MMASDYVCTLESKYLKKAKEELNENETDRLDAVQALRKWINDQEHIKYDSSTKSFFIFFVFKLLKN